MLQITEAAQSTAKGADESVLAAAQLTRQTEELKTLVGKFRL
jgi:methyl-accepting chemotaxis protein